MLPRSAATGARRRIEAAVQANAEELDISLPDLTETPEEL